MFPRLDIGDEDGPDGTHGLLRRQGNGRLLGLRWPDQFSDPHRRKANRENNCGDGQRFVAKGRLGRPMPNLLALSLQLFKQADDLTRSV